jgi:hypothetical protein
MRVPIPQRMCLYYRHLRSFFEWYKKQVEKDPNYGKKRKPRKHKK